MIVRNTGHATILVKTKDRVIYFDPFSLPKNPPKADLVLVTHSHYDHFDRKRITEISKESTVIVHHDCDCNGLNMNAGDVRVVKGVKIEAVQAYNTNKHFHPRNLGVGFVVEIEGKRIYHAGDTDVIPEMSELENIDLACLPIAGTYTMNEEEAVQAVELIKPKAVMPMHFDSIVKGDPQRFKKLVESKGITVHIRKAVF